METLFIIIFFFFSLSVALTFLLQVQKKHLQEEQARFQASINSINVGFMVINTNLEMVMINTAAKQIIFNQGKTGSPAILRNSPTAHFNYSLEEIQTRLAGSYDLKAKLDKALQLKTTVSDKNVPFGELFLRVFITPTVVLEKKEGLGLEYIGAVILIEDITQQLIIERSKDEFFSIASHELRTPLTAIRGNSSLIEQYYLNQIQNPDLKEIVHDIHDSSIRLINIVNDFLDVSRLEQGRIEYHKATFGLLGLTQEVVKELGTLVAQKGLYLKVESDNPPPIVYADKERVKQAIVNLIGNALKFTTKGGITIRFGSEKGMVKCMVIDTGAGIPAQNQKLLFHKFQQASSNILTRDVTGTGLGLYISKLMIEAQGGKIYLESSQEGQGTTFSFTLPISAEASLHVNTDLPPQVVPISPIPPSNQLTSVGQT